MTIATSVIVPTLESPTLGATLLALGAEIGGRGDVEVIVAGLDTAGARGASPAARYVPTAGPVFPGAARNHGASVARGRRLLFLDSDCRPRRGWLRALETTLDIEPCGASGAVVFGPESYWQRVDNVSLFHEFVPGAARGRRRFLPSLTLGIDRAVFERIGGFDPGLRSAEDLDLTARLTLAGVPLFFEPSASVMHRPTGRRTAGEIWRRHVLYGRNSARVRLRYPAVFGAPLVLRAPLLMAACAPALALATVGRILATEPAARPFARWAPGVALTKLAWCYGAALCRPLILA